MARIRTVKPDFFRHAGLFDAEQQSGFPIRIAFEGLWTAADREGRFAWEPRTLKLDCLPFDQLDFADVMDVLWLHGFIQKYTVDGKDYGFIPSWLRHQHINQREAQSRLPEPTEENICVHVLAHGEGKGRERKGREKDKTELRSALVPHETISIESPKRQPTKYGFEGTIIKLKQVHFDNWVKGFPAIDLLAELLARDVWLSSDRATDEDRRNWFISTSKYLANRNMEAKAKVVALKPGGPPSPAPDIANIR